MRRKPIFCLIFTFLFCFSVQLAEAQNAPLKLAGVFGEHMVLQRDQEIPVWGWATPKQEVTVTLAGKEAKATANEKGKWMAKLDSLPAGGPHELKVTGKETISVSDVLIGEVWLCSGQSNMAMSVGRSQDFEKEKGLAKLPKIRMITINKHATPDIQNDCKGEWEVASAETVGKFSATAWFFGRKLHEELDVPVGLINSSWGGTDIAAWTSRSAQEKNETLSGLMASFDEGARRYDAARAKQEYEAALKAWQEKKAGSQKPGRKPKLQADPMVNQNRPSNLFNGMINPLVPYGIRGAIWYQGERNAKSIESGTLYEQQLKLMISDWRARWGLGDFPFITVQLPNYKSPTDDVVENSGWVKVRESQLRTLKMKNTGIAITTDVGMEKDIHPTNKQAVGLRLALWALGTTYEKEVVYSGPILSYFQFDPANENRNGRCSIIMAHTGEGLKANDGGKELKGFAIAGEDQVFHPAKASYSNGNGKLFVSSDEIETPVAVRYNWANNPKGNVVNSAGLPMAPFRTDNWKIE